MGPCPAACFPQVITLEGWVDIMYYVMDAHSFYNFIYFILLIIVSVGMGETSWLVSMLRLTGEEAIPCPFPFAIHSGLLEPPSSVVPRQLWQWAADRQGPSLSSLQIKEVDRMEGSLCSP